MVLRINPSRMPLWRSPTEMQFGLDIDAPRIRDLTQAQERLIKMLYRGMPDNFLPEAARNLGVENHEEILQAVSPVLLNVTFPQVDEDFVNRNFAEICRAQSTYNHSGEAVIAKRKLHAVYLSECGATTKLLTDSLSNSGIGKITQSQSARADFAVLIANHVLAPSAYSHWLNECVPHIAILFDEKGVTVSPVIETGKTPCLTCFHEQQKDRDSSWPELASQLLFSEQRFDDATSSLFGSAIACQRALESIDLLGNFAIQSRNRIGYRLDIASGSVSEYRWDFSERCLCK